MIMRQNFSNSYEGKGLPSMTRTSTILLVSLITLFTRAAFSEAIPSKYIELLDYVQEAPDQGQTNSCLYVASTGAMELIANKRHGIKNPQPYGPFDLAEAFTIHAPKYQDRGRYFWEKPILKFNRGGYGIHTNDWQHDAWNGTEPDRSIWRSIRWSGLPKVTLPQVDTVPLFVKGNRWSTNVLDMSHVQQIKHALWKNKAPVLINYNDNKYWHVILVVGYDDNIPGNCYQITDAECGSPLGAFYVRDSFGRVVEMRDYDWFRVRGNAAFAVKEK